MRSIKKPYSFLLIVLISLMCYGQKPDWAANKDYVDLEKWKTVKVENQKYWSVTDSLIIGGDGTQKIPENTYLCTTKTYENFEFRCLFRLSGNHDMGLLNSGIQYRSIIEEGKTIGYQADIGKGYWGDIYDEHRRGKLVAGDLSTLKHILNKRDGTAIPFGAKETRANSISMG